MVGERRQRDADRPPEAFRKNAEYEYDGAVFSVDYAERSDLFEGLSIWQEEKYRQQQEAYIGGYWEELTAFIRNLFGATFKTNPYMERAIMTGITRVSKESVFSDLKNLKVVTTTSPNYADCFGFTEKEVFEALEEYGLSDQKQLVKYWYDGFAFGSKKDIYNPWSIINFLDEKKVGPYWANTSSNGLAGKLLRKNI